MTKPLTDAELQAVVKFVAGRYLEVERGLRDLRTLRRFLDPALYARQRSPAAARFGKGGIVTAADFGQVDIRRPQPGCVEAIVAAREEGDRWGALVVELRADARGRWRVTDLARVQDRTLGRAPAQHVDAEGDRQHRKAVQAASDSRDEWARCYDEALEAFRAAAPERPLGELRAGDVILIAPDPPQWATVANTRQDAATDALEVHTSDGIILTGLSHRLVPAIAARHDGHEQFQEAARAAAQDLVQAERELVHWERELTGLPGDQPDYLVRVLGERPWDGPLRQIWDDAAGTIEAYRQRWNVTDTDMVLGQPQDGQIQAADRNAVAAVIRAAATHLIGNDKALSAGLRETTHEPGTEVGVGHSLSTTGSRSPLGQPWDDIRLPLEPLLRAVSGRSGTESPGHRGPIADAADVLKVTRRTVHRWRKTGVSPPLADHLAVRAGMHPLVIWGPSWDLAPATAHRVAREDSRLPRLALERGPSLDRSPNST